MKDLARAVFLVAEEYGIKFTRLQYDIYVKEHNLPSHSTLEARFDNSFTKAKEYFLGQESANKKPFSEKLLKEAFVKVKEKHGPKFTKNQYKDFTVGTHYPSVTIIYKKYGSFNEAKRELLGAYSVNYWGSTVGINYKIFDNVDKRLLSLRMREYKELELSDDDILKNIENYERDKEFADYCLTCMEIKSCHQNKKRCEYW